MRKESLKILLIEDDVLTAKTNKRILSSYGDVQIAKNIDTAHKLLNEASFDVAFFDLNLHGELDGLKLLK